MIQKIKQTKVKMMGNGKIKKAKIVKHKNKIKKVKTLKRIIRHKLSRAKKVRSGNQTKKNNK